MEKLLIIGEFTAPYRVEVFAELAKVWVSKIYFEFTQDEKRTSEWLKRTQIDCEILNNKASRKSFFKEFGHLKQYDAVVLYNNCIPHAILMEVFCKLAGVPFFVNCDGCNDIEEPNLVKHLLKCFLMRGAAGYFAGSRSAKEYFLHYGAKEERIHMHNFTSLHPNDILKELPDDCVKAELKNELQIREDFAIITVGRHIECKGFDIVLKAAERLGKSVGFYIVGGMPSEENAKYKEEHGLQQVHFVDFMNKEMLTKYYQATDIFVLMTRGDTWGLVINEAMANGLPVITTTRCVAGVELVENDRNGYIIDVDDVNALVDKIEHLKRNPQLCRKMACNNLEAMQDNTIENISQSHIEVLQRYFAGKTNK